MDQLLAALDDSWRVLVLGIAIGAGLPTLFALGVKSLAWGLGGDVERHAAGEFPKPHLPGRIIAYTLFAIVILVAALGITYIVAHGQGWVITFDGIVPVFTPK
ncbi:MAG: hypothetical protein LBR20_04675 [Propionibacteriaceae bacterium]|jgi:hypothetical protein|nr:hypothetical protein [Propionibacteriaceae bacterium]